LEATASRKMTLKRKAGGWLRPFSKKGWFICTEGGISILFDMDWLISRRVMGGREMRKDTVTLESE